MDSNEFVNIDGLPSIGASELSPTSLLEVLQGGINIKVSVSDLSKPVADGIELKYEKIEYSQGNVISSINQYIELPTGGEFSTKKTTDLPYTLTGDWAIDSVFFDTDSASALRNELTSQSGYLMVGGSPFISLEKLGATGGDASKDTTAFRAAIAEAISTGFPISLNGSKEYLINDEASTVSGNVKIYGNGAKITGVGNKLLDIDGSVYAEDIRIENAFFLKPHAITAIHDHLHLKNIKVKNGQVVHARQADTSLMVGYRDVSITGCDQDNNGFTARRGICLFLRYLDKVVVEGCLAINSYRQGIMIGQNDATYRCEITSARAIGNIIRTVRNLGGAEAQGIEINDAKSAWMTANYVTDVAFDDGVPATGCEGLYVRGGRHCYITFNTLVDAGGGQGNILMKSEQSGLAAFNIIRTTDIRPVNGVTGMYSRHRAIGNQITIYGTPSGFESRGVWLGYESGHLGDFVNMRAEGNQIYFQGNGTGREIGIDFFFGSSTGVTSAYTSGNYVRGNSDNPIFAGLKLSNGGEGLEMSGTDFFENCQSVIDVYSESIIKKLTLKGKAVNVDRVTSLRGTGAYSVSELIIDGLEVENTRQRQGVLTMFDASRVQRFCRSKRSVFTGFIDRIFSQFGGAKFTSSDDTFSPSSEISAPIFFRLFDAKPSVVKISDGNFNGTRELVAIQNAAGSIGTLWVYGNDCTGVNALPSSGVTKKYASNNLGYDLT